MKPCQLLFAENTQPQNNTGCYSHKAVDQEACLKDDRDDQRRGADDKQNVEDIAAHNIANGNIRITLTGSGHGSEQFRQRKIC